MNILLFFDASFGVLLEPRDGILTPTCLAGVDRPCKLIYLRLDSGVLDFTGSYTSPGKCFELLLLLSAERFDCF